MSVILEFTIDDEAFLLGQVLSPPPKMHIELERLVPTGSMVMPYLWVTGGDTDDFEANVRAHSNVKEFQVLNRLGDRVLYRIE